MPPEISIDRLFDTVDPMMRNGRLVEPMAMIAPPIWALVLPLMVLLMICPPAVNSSPPPKSDWSQSTDRDDECFSQSLRGIGALRRQPLINQRQQIANAATWLFQRKSALSRTQPLLTERAFQLSSGSPL